MGEAGEMGAVGASRPEADVPVLIAGGGRAEPARAVARRLSGLALDVHTIVHGGLRDPAGTFAEAYGLGPTGASLVRPDGVVAWRARAPSSDPESALAGALQAIPSRTSPKMS